MAVDIDVRQIASFASLPSTSITTILEDPTVELVKSLLANISAKAKEYEQIKSEKVRLEVELESSVRSSESKIKVLKNSVEKGLSESSKLRTELHQAENARSNLESEVQQIKASTSQDASESVSLKSRISSLEASNRDTLAVLGSKSTAYDKLAEELSSQYQKAVELRRQVSTLEQNLQAANSASAATRYREENLQREIDLLKRNNDWYGTELKTKSDEYLKFRKERAARITDLQRQSEQQLSEIDSFRRAEAALKNRLDDLNSKYEDSLQNIQDLKEEAIQNTENFRIEIESSKRLADLQRASAETAKKRAQELTNSLDEVRDESAEELGRLRAELQSELDIRQAAEQKIGDMDEQISQLEEQVKTAEIRPSTPQPQVNGNLTGSPLRPSTPREGLFSSLFSPRSSVRGKGSLTMTQLYAEFQKVTKDLENKKRDNQLLHSSIEEMMAGLENTGPELEELRNDKARFESELSNMSSLLDAANNERGTAVKEARKWQGQVQGLMREGGILRQQLRDLSSQIKILLLEQHLRENGQQMNREEMEELEKAASVREEDLSGLNDTGRIISEQLTTFRNIAALQEQNIQLERMLRELGNEMEKNESLKQEQAYEKQREENEALNDKVTRLGDELQNVHARMTSFQKERDMFKSLALRKEPATNVDPSSFARSMPLPTSGSPGSDSELAKVLKEVQSNFDAFREESATDRSTLKTQVDDLSKRNNQLQTDSSRTLSQLAAANQRFEMLQSNFGMLKTENEELSKRANSVTENANKQEIKAQQAAEELVEARGLVDSMRRETLNLKAEKDLWKSVETRLVDDNESLRNERGRLDKLNASLQNILNEREHSDSETRRRLQSSVEALEADLHTTRRKLNDEVEEHKKSTLRRDYESDQSQKRVSDLLASNSSIREELAATKTTKDHLQARVEEMTVELRSAEERLQVLQSKPPAGESQSNDEETSVTREQELAVEVSELKRDLELKTAELERANEQIEDYKGISQASEERLQELAESSEQYEQESGRLLAERDEKIRELEQRIEDITAELSATNSQLSTLRDEHSESARHLDEQRSLFETEIVRLKDQTERHAATAKFHQEDLKAQASIAQQAQENYETELLRHAEAAKTLQAVRTEFNEVKLQIAEFRAQAENARNDLKQKEESWGELKTRYEREVSDLKLRREEISHQNNILHQQMESVTKQISSLQQDRTNILESQESGTGVAFDLESNQETINFLRQEKEIAEIRFSQLETDSKRLRQQLNSTTSQLEEARLKLEQHRRSELDAERNALNHKKLMDTLNELNLYRESSVTLRAQAKAAETALAEKSQRVDELTTQIEPLQVRIGELENLTEAREGEMKLVQEDRDRWQKRTQDILQKYDRVDPVELQELKDKVSTLEAERAEIVAAKDLLQIQIDGFPEQIDTAKKEQRDRLADQFKSRSKQQSDRIREKQSELDAANAEKVRLQAEIDTAKAELNAARQEVDTVKSQHHAGSTEVNGLPAPAQGENAIPSEPTPRVQELEARIAELESAVASKQEEADLLKTTTDEKFKAREDELKSVLNKRLAQVKAEAQAAKDAALKEVRETLTQEHQKELESVRANTEQPATENAPLAPPRPDSQSQDEIPTLSEAQARKVCQHNQVIRNIILNNIRGAITKEKEKWRQEKEAPSSQANTTEGAPTDPAVQAALEKKFAAERDAAVQEQINKFLAEREALVQELERKFTAEKEALIKEQQQKQSEQYLTFSEESKKQIAAQVELAEKRSLAKLNMSTNRANQMKAKIDVVEKAANETPDKAVKEVWEAAKVAKPVQQQPGQIKAPISTTSPSQAALQPQSPAVPSPKSDIPVPQTIPPAQTQAPSGIQPNASAPSQQQQPSNQPTEPASTAPKSSQSGIGNHVATGPGTLRAPGSTIPRGTRGGGRGATHAQTQQQPTPSGTGTDQQQQTARPPSAQGGSVRGSSIPRGGLRGRGRGRGGGEGGAQNAQASGLRHPSTGGGATAAGAQAPGGLNPNAKQFDPGPGAAAGANAPVAAGNKRAREDGDTVGESGDGGQGAGKRPRGGGQIGGGDGS
ncbi:MAG: hypothetical protein Q9160_006361 [Pyrenula sp. 1 TL-2023]